MAREASPKDDLVGTAAFFDQWNNGIIKEHFFAEGRALHLHELWVVWDSGRIAACNEVADRCF